MMNTYKLVSLVSAVFKSEHKSCMNEFTNTVGLLIPVLKLSHTGFERRGAANKSTSHWFVEFHPLSIN